MDRSRKESGQEAEIRERVGSTLREVLRFGSLDMREGERESVSDRCQLGMENISVLIIKKCEESLITAKALRARI
jgi:hypothetical protein